MHNECLKTSFPFFSNMFIAHNDLKIWALYQQHFLQPTTFFSISPPKSLISTLSLIWSRWIFFIPQLSKLLCHGLFYISPCKYLSVSQEYSLIPHFPAPPVSILLITCIFPLILPLKHLKCSNFAPSCLPPTYTKTPSYQDTVI